MLSLPNETAWRRQVATVCSTSRSRRVGGRWYTYKTNGYRLYNYFGNNIYLKYNAKKHKKFNTSEGGINGIVIYLDNRVYDITFNEEEYKNQKELNSILDDMKSFIITNS